MTDKDTAVTLADEALDLHDRLYQAYLDETDKRDGNGPQTWGDPRRSLRLLRLSHMAADRWRRMMGYPPMYNNKGAKR